MEIIDVPLWAQVIVLAVIQGIAEFLPISSSGHVVVVSTIFGITESAELNVVLHLGTLFSILLFYRKRIIALLSVDGNVIKWLIIGTIPAAVIGIMIKTQFGHILENPLLAGLMFPVTGGFLLLMRFMPKRSGDYRKISLRDVLIIGTFQAFALLPGISRSGSTILAGVMMGQDRQSATTFSFLLAIPAILGAASIEMFKIAKDGSSTPMGLLLAGLVVAFLVGLFALHWLVKWVESGKLHWFAFYLFPIGAIVVIWRLSIA